MEEMIYNNVRYLVRYPNGFDKNKKYPILLFFHGAGTRGTNINALKSNPFFAITDKYADFPFVTIAPLCTENTWFDMFEGIKSLVKEITNMPFADSERIYLIGASMGGYATWQLAMSMPEYFAAIVPICGGGMCWNAARLQNVPVLAFHGAKDKTVSVEESVKMVDAVNKHGGNAKLTIYPENTHDAWSDTYSNYEVFEWLLTHTNKNTNQIKDEYNNSNIYG